MVDPDPGYRPRRAAGPDHPPNPAPAGPTGPASPARPGGAAEPPSSTGPSGSTPRSAAHEAAATAARSPSGATAASSASEASDPTEQPKPLYRDELGESPAPQAGSAGGVPAGDEETRIVRPLNFRQRRPQPADEDATTLLARTGPGGRRASRDEDALDDEGRSRPLLGSRGRLALLVSAVAAVVVVGLAILYAVTTVGDPSAQPSASAPAGASSGGGTPTPSDTAALLGDATLLTPAAAQQIEDRTWRVALTERTITQKTPVPGCLSNEPVDGEPTAQQKVVRVLTGSGKSAPTALHSAAAYASPEEAAQAYAVAARTLGGCASPGAYIADGVAVTGLGDQSVGLVVTVVADGKTQWHSVVMSRTGRVLNLLDAVRGDKALGAAGVARALGAVTAAQCEAAGGQCTAAPTVKAAPPPVGGDVPGFLAAGDLPPVGKADESWVATPVDQSSKDFLGSQCETLDWTRTGATVAASRVYLVPSSTTFGLNDIVLTMGNEKAASALVAKIRADLQSCSKRQLTASVSKPLPVKGPGASGSEVVGWTATVEQKTTAGTQRFRVGIVSSGSKVAYTFLNPLPDGYDLTPGEWDMVAVRAGQRMTQVR